MLSKGFSRICLLSSAQRMSPLMTLLTCFSFSSWYLLKIREEKCRIASHLEELEFDVSLVATEWFLCLFSKSLPSEVGQNNVDCPSLTHIPACVHTNTSFWIESYFRLKRRLTILLIVEFISQTTLRVWDVLFYEGAKVLFHVALAIFKVVVLLLLGFAHYLNFCSQVYKFLEHQLFFSKKEIWKH